MSRFAFVLVAVAGLCVVGLPAPSVAATDASTTGDPVAAVPSDPAAAVAPTPLQAAIEAAVLEERTQVAELAAQLATAPDDATALALHRAIEKAKLDGQVRVLGVQVEFARREGRLEDAARIEAAIAAMGRPAVPAQAEPRPAPGANRADGR